MDRRAGGRDPKGRVRVNDGATRTVLRAAERTVRVPAAPAVGASGTIEGRVSCRMERVLVSLDEVHFIAIDATDLSFECGDEAPERPLSLSHHRMAGRAPTADRTRLGSG